MLKLYKSLFVLYLLVANSAFADILDQQSVTHFIDHMVTTHHYNADDLQSIFRNAKLSRRVLEAISRPAEKLPWYKYRPIFLQPDRIQQGIIFWDKYKSELISAEKHYGVPPKIIVAIIGVETRYGKFTGKDKVIDALATLAFHYPKRSKFFRDELEQYLLLTNEQNIDPLLLTGSYAGAMGIPQFIPSSYRNYAIDFDNDGKIDIWNNPADAIGSVANYFKQHGWKSGEQIAIRAWIEGDGKITEKNTDLKPDIGPKELKKYGIKSQEQLSDTVKLKVLNFENRKSSEIWLGLNNFYVITRYNHSPLYAMAVYQLAEEISKEYEEKFTAIK